MHPCSLYRQQTLKRIEDNIEALRASRAELTASQNLEEMKINTRIKELRKSLDGDLEAQSSNNNVDAMAYEDEATVAASEVTSHPAVPASKSRVRDVEALAAVTSSVTTTRKNNPPASKDLRQRLDYLATIAKEATKREERRLTAELGARASQEQKRSLERNWTPSFVRKSTTDVKASFASHRDTIDETSSMPANLRASWDKFREAKEDFTQRVSSALRQRQDMTRRVASEQEVVRGSGGKKNRGREGEISQRPSKDFTRQNIDARALEELRASGAVEIEAPTEGVVSAGSDLGFQKRAAGRLACKLMRQVPPPPQLL